MKIFKNKLKNMKIKIQKEKISTFSKILKI